MGRAALLLVALVVLGACQLVPPDVAKQILPERTEYKTLEAAYHVLLERHVDRPTPEKLLTGALDGADAYLHRQPDGATTTPGPTASSAPVGTDPSRPSPAPASSTSPAGGPKGAGCSDVVIARPQLTGSSESDLVKAGEALDAAVAACKTADKTQIERAAVDGMAKAMAECHTYYLDPDRAKAFNQPPQQYSGIGATILASSTPGGMSEISAVFPDSPAEKAGVKAGDRIKRVDGSDVTGFSPDEIAAKIRGPEGTQVKLVLVRGTDEIMFTITRATLTPPRVIEREFDSGKIAMLSISQLNGDVAKATKDLVKRDIAAGAKAFIVDLRNDPGGDLSAAVDIASIFLKDATLVDQVGRDGKKEQVRTDDGFFVDFKGPVVVMVNERSASGAEIIAAGLRSNGVATVVGTRSAACVGIAQPRQMPDGGLLLVTLARMQDVKTGAELNGRDPACKGTDVECRRGVSPDVSVKDDPNTPAQEDVLAAVDALRTKLAAQPSTGAAP